MELALASFIFVHHHVIVSPAAAQYPAPLFPRGGCVALPALGAERPQRAVGRAEGGGLLGVDEVDLAGGFDGLALGDEAVAVVAGDYLGGAVEALLEPIAHVAEGGHLAPAGFEGARAGEAVAFAFGTHVVFDCLENEARLG